MDIYADLFPVVGLQPTERVYASLTEGEQTLLLERHPVVWCRALELSQRPAILHYDDIALSCAEYGLLNALERSDLNLRHHSTLF